MVLLPDHTPDVRSAVTVVLNTPRPSRTSMMTGEMMAIPTHVRASSVDASRAVAGRGEPTSLLAAEDSTVGVVIVVDAIMTACI